MPDTPNGDFNGQSNPPDDTFEIVALAKNACINTNHKIVQVVAELENVEWDVVLFSETRYLPHHWKRSR